MTQTMTKVVADFNTTLSLKVAVGDTTATLTSATDDDGVALLTGTYGLTIDRKSSSKEFIQCTITGTAVTAVYSVSRQGVKTSGFARTHRKGAEVIISDWSSLKRINDILDGTVDLDSGTPLKYDGTASISTANQLATKAYVDGVAIAGAPDASTTVKGIVKMSTAPVSPTSPIAVGDNDTRVPTSGQAAALPGNNTDIAVGSGNKFVTQTGLQHNAEKYVTDTSSSSTTYVATFSPAPTSQTDGMHVYVKFVNANTTTTPTLAINGLTARTIVKTSGIALAVGDIAANSFHDLVYDLTNNRWVLQTPVNNEPLVNLVPAQDIIINAAALINCVNSTSNNDGSIMITGTIPSGGSSSVITLSRYAKDTLTSQLFITHSVTFDNGAGAYVNTPAMVIIGNYVYVSYSVSTTGYCKRFDLADLTNATTITISGTSWGGYSGSSFTDGTYIYNINSTGTGYNKYSISGTTITYVSATTYTSANDVRELGGTLCNGINVWFLYNNSDTLTIQKYVLAGGAVISTTTKKLFLSTVYNGKPGGGFFYSTSILGIISSYSSSTPTAMAGTIMKLNAITLP